MLHFHIIQKLEKHPILKPPLQNLKFIYTTLHLWHTNTILECFKTKNSPNFTFSSPTISDKYGMYGSHTIQNLFVFILHIKLWKSKPIYNTNIYNITINKKCIHRCKLHTYIIILLHLVYIICQKFHFFFLKKINTGLKANSET